MLDLDEILNRANKGGFEATNPPILREDIRALVAEVRELREQRTRWYGKAIRRAHALDEVDLLRQAIAAHRAYWEERTANPHDDALYAALDASFARESERLASSTPPATQPRPTDV